jgi:glycosyltransferase involved in cell wall biosynthesis
VTGEPATTATIPPARPRISVVVSTYDRPARLRRLLEALRAQTVGRDAFEVVVVDNGSGPETERVLSAERARGGLDLRCERNPVTLGPAGGRNAGWRTARAPLVAFTDDDCRPAPGWLGVLLGVCAAHPAAIVQGPTRPDPEEASAQGWLAHTVCIERLGPQFETCNIVYPRALLERLAGFDESFGLRPAGEDTDLAWRAIEAGSATVFASEAVVWHAVEPVGVRGRLRIAARWGPVVRVLAEHPGSRAILFRGRFWNVWHYLMWRSLLAAAGPAWLRRLVLARHLMTLRERARREGAGRGGVAFLVLHDAVECWAIARGAVRHRMLVL